MCEYMQHHIGEEYDGVISGITNYGIYVALPSTIEGMIPLRTLDSDYYVFHEDKYELVGERTGKAFHLGDPIHIAVVNADKLTRTIDFMLMKPEKKD